MVPAEKKSPGNCPWAHAYFSIWPSAEKFPSLQDAICRLSKSFSAFFATHMNKCESMQILEIKSNHKLKTQMQ
jgi:hypothetical protein